ncbi:hypothetical protein Y695_02814 [Hydrogenophaga sp. T4]|nr:hypothetical protein Y695_02814 [Hydrogenophaga sp. T4]
MAAVVGSAAVFGWHLIKRRRPSDPSVRAMRSVNLDVGEVIQIEEWLPDGSASVKYRGAQWTVIQRPGNPPVPGATAWPNSWATACWSKKPEWLPEVHAAPA